MVQTLVSDEYIHSALICTTYDIFPVRKIKQLINQDGEPTTPHKMDTGMKPSVSNPCVLSCPCVFQKAIAHAKTEALNMGHQ